MVIFRRYLCLFLALMVLLCLFGCSAPTPIEQLPPTEAELLYGRLFDVRNKIEIELKMPEEEIAKLQADFEEYAKDKNEQSPIYRMADFIISITSPEGKTETYTYEQVGVRLKGTSYSRVSFYSKERGVYNLNHLKISFQETFDDTEIYGEDALSWTQTDRDARKKRTFATLEELDLKFNRSDDATYIRDYYSSIIFRESGLLCAQSNLSTVRWADMFLGVWTITEPVDKIFLERNLPKSAQGGDLYKCAYLTKFDGKDTIGIENEREGKFYLIDLKTNKKTSDFSKIKELIAMLNDYPSKEEIAEKVDIDQWLTFCAVSFFVGNPDDMRNDFNNFAVYFPPDTGKAIFIARDFDRGLGVTHNQNYTKCTMTQVSPYSTTIAWTGEDQPNPLFLYTVCSGGYYVREFTEKLAEVAKNPYFATDKFEEYYEISKNLYEKDTKPDKTFDNTKGKFFAFDINKTSPLTEKPNSSFSDYITARMRNYRMQVQDVEKHADVNVKISTDHYLSGSFNGFSRQEEYELGVVGEGVFGITVTFREQTNFNITFAAAGIRFGYNKLKQSDVNCLKDGGGNITISPGKYRIEITAVGHDITIKKL